MEPVDACSNSSCRSGLVRCIIYNAGRDLVVTYTQEKSVSGFNSSFDFYTCKTVEKYKMK